MVKKIGSITALLAWLSWSASANAAQVGFQNSSPRSAIAEVGQERCEEEAASDSKLKWDFESKPLISSAAPLALGLERQTLIAQAVTPGTPEVICSTSAAPQGAASIGGGGFPFQVLGVPAAAGVIAALATTGGGDDLPVTPEPGELATASLFASLGIAGVLLRRREKSSEK